MANVHSPAMVRAYRFGPYELDPAGELRKFDSHIKLQKKPFLLLLALVERPGEIVSRSELQERLWPGTYVDFEQNLNIAVKKVRDALCDDADEPKFIETIAGQGYRFVAAVETVLRSSPAGMASGDEAVADATASKPRPAWRPAWIFATGGALVLAVIIWGGWKLRQPRLSFAPHDYVLIGDFENRTGEPLLDGAVEAALRRELSNSGYVSVAPESRVNDALRLMGKPTTTRLDAQVAREVCLRDGGIDVLLSGRLQKLGNEYEISAFVVNPADGRTVFAASDTADTKEELLAGMHRVADSVRRRLGEDPESIRASGAKLERVTTPSLEALQLYSQGERAAEGRRWGEAEQFFRRAVARDPKFVSALNMLAWAVYQNQKSYTPNPEGPGPQREEYLALSEKAYQLADKATEREANFVRGTYHHFRGELAQAAAAYKAVVALYPDDHWSANNAVVVEMRQGHADEARLWTQRAAEMAPNRPYMNFRAWIAAMNRGEEDEAQKDETRLRTLQRADALPGGMKAILAWEPALRRASAGDVAGALNEARQVLAAPRPDKDQNRMVVMRAVFFFCALGRFAEAEQWAHASGLDPVDQEFAEERIAVERGDVRRLMAVIQKIQREFPDRLDARQFGANDLAHLGSYREARAATKAIPNYPRPTSALDMLTEGDIQRGEGNLQEAIRLLREASRQFDAIGTRTAVFSATESLARALDAKGDTEAAIGVLEPLERDPRFDYEVASGPTAARFLLAKLYRKAGRVTEARKVEAELLSFRSVADPDDPLLLELKRQSAQ